MILDDYSFSIGDITHVPIMQGGMGVNISARPLAVAIANCGGIGHLSDAMIPAVMDVEFDTNFVRDKLRRYKKNNLSRFNSDKSDVKFDIKALEHATKIHVREAMTQKRQGSIFINVMEKLTMNGPSETLRARLSAAMDAGIDGITLSAGLHLGTLRLIEDHPRFRGVNIGIVVSSVRALNVFLRKSKSTNRLPDYIIVEGPLAGGHLGFGMDWADYDLKTITKEVLKFLKQNKLEIPVIPAGGIFTGKDAVKFMKMGCAAVQVATRFTVTQECGLPYNVKQKYLNARLEDVEVNMISPTGYPMRMLKQSPGKYSKVRPNCEAHGYLLDKNGKCSYIDEWTRGSQAKTCLCTHMRNYDIWTCGQYVYRLKEVTKENIPGIYQLPTAKEVFDDYRYR